MATQLRMVLGPSWVLVNLMSGLGQGHLPEAWLGIKKARMKNRVREEKNVEEGKRRGRIPRETG